MSLARAVEKIDRLSRRFPLGFPSGYGEGNKYRATGNVEWTPAFWTGLLWLAYQYTGDHVWRKRAEALNPSFAARLDAAGPGVDTHDLGFLYMLSSAATYTLTGDPAARSLTLRAANLIMKRYWSGGRIIQAWGAMDDAGERGRVIVDSTMNMPLLFWAAQQTHRRDYADVAVSHLDQCVRYLIRDDGSTFHTYFVDTETGQGRGGRTCQGFADDSCWSRGQAWAIYGFSLAYRHTREDRFRDAARRVATYFLEHLPADGICYWDLTFRDEDRQERDTSAAAIAACGLLELGDHLAPDDPEGTRVRAAALGILETLTATYVSASPDEDGILLNGVCDWPRRRGVNECCLWGDYFYLEALVRQEPTWSSLW